MGVPLTSVKKQNKALQLVGIETFITNFISSLLRAYSIEIIISESGHLIYVAEELL